MAKRTPVDKLAETVQKILAEYGDEVGKIADDAVKKVAKAGVTALRNQSKTSFGGSGRYASGWTSKYENQRLGGKSIIYNNLPGLPHLLEHGHAKRGGGRVAGRVHIAPVEQQIERQLKQEVEAKL